MPVSGRVIICIIEDMGMERFIVEASEKEIKKGKEKARILRASAWWKRKRSEGVCYFCRRRIPPLELTMEHMVPLARGGKSTKSNIVAACKECNSRKKYLLPLEWEEYLDDLKRADP